MYLDHTVRQAHPRRFSPVLPLGGKYGLVWLLGPEVKPSPWAATTPIVLKAPISQALKT
jgi:hypothetical protein